MAQNPYYVQPGGDYSTGLKGLSGAMGQIGDRKREDEIAQRSVEKFAKMKQGALDAYKTGDPNKMAEFSLANPEMSQAMDKAMGFRNKQTSDNYKDSLFSFYQNPTEENATELIQDRQQLLQNQGVGPEGSQETDSFMQRFAQDPEGTKAAMAEELAFRYPKEWKAMRDATKEDDIKLPTTAMSQFIKNNPGATSEELINFTQKLSTVKQKGLTGKTYSKKNADGSVRTIKNVKPGSDQEKQLLGNQFVEGSQTIGAKMSAEERKDQLIRSNTDKLSNLANEDPNKFYEEQNYRQNDDGSLYLDPVTDLPVKLMPFFKATGKRGNIKAMQAMGEQWDDAKELQELLSIPTVQENLSKANADGIWDKVSGKWSNTINKWMQDKGIGGNSNTATAIARIQKMASEERKLYMGTAVTDNEMKSALAWMPSAGDSYESMVNKTALMGKEAEQSFRRWIDIFSKDADMSPFYKAFGIKRFDGEEAQKEDKSKIKFLGFE